MPVEKFANNFETTLAAGASASDVSIQVSTAAPVDLRDGQFRIRVGDEIMLVTATAAAGASPWTVTRGVEGTAAAIHASGATVTHVLTRDSLATHVTITPDSSSRNIIQASVVGTTPLVIKAVAGQTANLQEWQDSAGAVLASLAPGGRFSLNTEGLYLNAPSNVFINKSNATGSLIVNSEGSLYFQQGSTSRLQILGTSLRLGDVARSSSAAHTTLVAGTAASSVPLIVLPATGQTADLQQWRDGADALLSKVGADGGVNFANGLIQTTTGANRRVGIERVPATTLDVNGTINADVFMMGYDNVFQRSSNFLALAGTFPNGAQAPWFTAGPINQIKLATLYVEPNAATEKLLILRGAASQTANLQEWQDSAGGVLARVDTAGRLYSTAEVQAFSGVASLGNNKLSLQTGAFELTGSGESAGIVRMWGQGNNGTGVRIRMAAPANQGARNPLEIQTDTPTVVLAVTSTGALDLVEQATPATPAANTGRTFVRDSGGVTQLCVKFPSGNVVVIAEDF